MNKIIGYFNELPKGIQILTYGTLSSLFTLFSDFLLSGEFKMEVLKFLIFTYFSNIFLFYAKILAEKAGK